MQKVLTTILLAALGLYAAACLLLFVRQRALIYFPPAVAAFAVPDSTILHVPGAVLKVSERRMPGTRALLYLGGNAEDVSASLPLLARAFPERALFLLHYRSYAGSSGSPGEAALVADALALFDRIAAGHQDIVIVGRSLGSGIAVQVASRRKPGALVLVTPYDSLQELAVRQFPWFPVRWLLRDKYESWRHAPAVSAPTYIVAAQHDEIIPAWSTALLLSRFGAGVARRTVIEGAGHNTISDSPAYLAALRLAD